MLLPSFQLPDRIRLALILALVIAGVAPWLPILGWAPWGADAWKWVARGADVDWLRWDLASRHFVGYRPVAALTYTVNHAIGGFAPWVYRITDLGLYAVSAVLLVGVWLRATGDRSSAVFVPLALVLGHPVIGEIVPYVGRRSYLLATVFALGALLAALQAGHSAQSRRLEILAAVLAGFAGLSNEVGFAVVPALVLARPRIGGPLLLVVAGLSAARLAVLGAIGGYEQRYMATWTSSGGSVVEVADTFDPRRILAACLAYTVAPLPVAPRWEGLRTVFVALVVGWWGFIGLVQPIRRWDEPARRIPLVFAVWWLGALAIVVASQTWFWRLAYPVLVPAALLTAWGLRDGLRAMWRGQAYGLVSAAIGAATFAAMVGRGPLLRGIERADHRATIDATPVIAKLEPVLRGLRGPGTVWLVVPVGPATAQGIRQWGEVIRRDLSFRVLATLPPGAAADEAGLRIERDPPRLFLESGYFFPPAMEVGDGPLDLSRLARGGQAQWLVAIEPDAAWAVALR